MLLSPAVCFVNLFFELQMHTTPTTSAISSLEYLLNLSQSSCVLV